MAKYIFREVALEQADLSFYFDDDGLTVNSFISKAALEARRARYKKGARVELISMTDPYTKLKPGDMGTVDFVDDTGTVFIIWDSGSHLGAVFGEDEIRLLSSPDRSP